MPLDQANWQIQLTASDRTANAFRSVEQNMRRLDTASKTTGETMSSGFATVTRLLGPLAAALATANVVTKAWTAGMAAADLEEQAQQIGLNTDQLQAYRLVAAQSGVSTEQLDTMMTKLTRSMGTANEGSDEMIARFDKLGVKLLDGNKRLRSTADVLPEVARGLLDMGDGAERDALMMELFGKSGTRGITILEQLARGNAAVIDEAKQLNAVIGIDTIRAWDALDAQLKIAEAQSKKTWAELGAPIVTASLEAYNKLLVEVNGNLDRMKQQQKLGNASAAAVGDTQMLKEQLEAQENLLKINPNNKMAQASADALRKRLAAAQQEAEAQKAMDAAQALFGDVGSPPTQDGGSKGGAQPIGKGAAKAGEDLAKKRLAESKQLYEQILAEQEKMLKAGEALQDRFGDGSATLARGMENLNEMYARGTIDIGTYNRALQDQIAKADDMDRAYRGASGGMDGFFAGIEQGFIDMERASSAFNIGKQMVSEFSSTIADLATGAEVDFGRILQSFTHMLTEMAVQWAMNSIFSAIGGGGGMGGGLGGIGGSLGSWLGGLLGGLFADGGRPPLGRVSVVGEQGPELFVPDGAGTIFNREQVAGMGGGGGSVVVQQTIYFGSDVSRSEFNLRLRQVEESTTRGAKAALLDDRRRGGASKNVFK